MSAVAAYATKAALKTALTSWNMNRGNLPLDELIALGESWLNREFQAEQIEIIATLTGVQGSRFIDLPADFSEPKKLFIDLGVGGEEVPFINRLMETDSVSTRPLAWSLESAKVAFPGPCDQAYTFYLTYLPTFGLAADGDSNFLLANGPDLYLAAAMLQCARFQKNKEDMATWTGARDEALESFKGWLNRQKRLARLRADTALQLIGRRRTFNIQTGN